MKLRDPNNGRARMLIMRIIKEYIDCHTLKCRYQGTTLFRAGFSWTRSLESGSRAGGSEKVAVATEVLDTEDLTRGERGRNSRDT